MKPKTLPGQWDTLAPIHGNRPHTLAVPRELNDRAEELAAFKFDDFTLRIVRGREVLWLVARLANKGGVAVRGIYAPDGDLEIHTFDKSRDGVTVGINGTTMGQFRGELRILNRATGLFRWKVWLTPAVDLLMPPQPWNIYPINQHNDPTTTRGIVYAAQRGTAMGCLFFSLTEPQAGSCFYMQNLTALNPYCEQTETVPDGIVGQNWPGMGFTPPPTDEHPLKSGEEVSLCDALLQISKEIPADNRRVARMFLDSTAEIYTHLDCPPIEYRDWPQLAAATARDLANSPKCWLEEHGYLYLHAYTASEYPDSMVQLTVLLGLNDYERWLGERFPLSSRLREAVPNFFDPKLGMMRRYLATVGADKNADQADSWYIYHPLLNLARLASDGDSGARELFLKSLPYVINVARHFDYVWPVMFDITTLAVITQNRKPGEAGQTDVGGLYAYVMLQAFDLTKDRQYVDEAVKAIRALADLGFSLGYQFNNVAWGVVACLRLFKLVGDSFYLDQANVFLASFFHNVILWDCDLGPAKYYPTFMGVTCLHDGPYMAAYEEFEAFAAFHEALEVAGADLAPSARLLVTEYCRHALDRAWYFYPANLPAEILSKEVRNGHIDRTLALPLEDLYASRDAPGKVGQEIYGAGMAFTLVVRSHHHDKRLPFTLYCDYPMREMKHEKNRVTFRTWGEPGQRCRCRLLALETKPVPDVDVSIAPASKATAKKQPQSKVAIDGSFEVPGGATVTLAW